MRPGAVEHPLVDAQQLLGPVGMQLALQLQLPGLLGEDEFHLPVPVQGDGDLLEVIGGQGHREVVPLGVLLILFP